MQEENQQLTKKERRAVRQQEKQQQQMAETRNKKASGFVIGIIIVLVIAAVVYAVVLNSKKNEQPLQLDDFTSCLKTNGAVFYGAFWCPHCNEQKKIFGSSASLLPYVECSTPDGRGQTSQCQQDNISSYPTWQFADGSRLSGAQSLEILAEKTNCALPNSN